MCKVVFEDNHLLVVEKPPNLLTQGDATGDDCLVERMKRYIGEKYHKPGAVYLGLIHRLDRPVGGLVALARTSKAAARLSEQLRSHAMEREYLAVVHGGNLPVEGTLVDWLRKDEAAGNVRVVTPAVENTVDQGRTAATAHTQGQAGARPQGQAKSLPQSKDLQQAALHFTVLAKDSSEDTALLHIQLETGRKHQIRVQLANSGHPILHDMRYGTDSAGQPIALWGSVLRLSHPITRQEMIFLSSPKGKAFDRYTRPLGDFFAARTQIQSHAKE